MTGQTLPADQVIWLAENLLKRHVVAFEVISLLLVGAAIGAMALNRGKSS
jgi:NADH:ubiquinone oxidoreductase subunit 6 (subunit J)